jgi:hypothetical protein
LNDLTLLDPKFDPNPHWKWAIDRDSVPGPESVALFDQNGYDLTKLEIEYAMFNEDIKRYSRHRNHTHVAIKQEWFSQPIKSQGAVLNHALIFERKGYASAALEQLNKWSEIHPILQKVARIRPKWGFDFSIDWADRNGNVFEILHYEFDGFDYNEVEDKRRDYEQRFAAMDWDDGAKRLLARKDEWHDLEFFAQSDYKCNFFGIDRERFKLVLWE